MTTNMYGTPMMGPQFNVSAMADIIHDLVGGGITHAHDGQWLRERVQVAGLGYHEHAALEALRSRMQIHSTALLDAAVAAISVW